MGGYLLSVMYVMFVLCTSRACIITISVRRRMFCIHVICAVSDTCAELWLIVFRCPRGIVTTSKEPVCPRVELIFKIIIVLLIIFLGFIKSKPC